MTDEAKPDGMTFSVIIPAYNEERLLRECLTSVRAQSYPSALVEVIVVDNGSTDRTLEIAAEFADIVLRHPGIRVGAMRNRGAEVASGSILAFLDADCLADMDWLRNAAASMAETPCVTGGQHALPEDPHWIERAWYAQEQRGRRAAHLIPSGNLLVPRDIFLDMGGFDESLISGEDAEFSLRAAVRLPVIADDSIRAVHLGNPKTVRKFLAREVWHGMGALGSVRLNWRDKPLIATGIFAMLTAAQIAGIVMLLGGGDGQVFLFASFGLALTLIATVGYRMWTVPAWNAIPALIFLYYVYFLGRAFAVVKLLLRAEQPRGER